MCKRPAVQFQFSKSGNELAFMELGKYLPEKRTGGKYLHWRSRCECDSDWENMPRTDYPDMHTRPYTRTLYPLQFDAKTSGKLLILHDFFIKNTIHTDIHDFYCGCRFFSNSDIG